jgi:signal transduction histidine kinase
VNLSDHQSRQVIDKSQRVIPVFQGIGMAGLIAAVVVQFVPATLLLLVQAEQASPLAWLSILLPGVLCVLAFMQRSGTNRVWSLNFVGLVLLVVQATMTQPEGPQWFPFLYAAFALAFGAAFSLPTIPAAAIVMAAAGLDALSVLRPQDHIIGSTIEIAGGAIGPLFILITGLGLVGVASSWRSVARGADQRALEIEQASDTSYRAFQVQSAKTLVQRRIHETVLNTLRAIAQGGPHHHYILREQCRRDVERLDEGLAPPAATNLHDIVNECWRTAQPRHVHFDISLPHDLELSAQTASVLRDALVESLRNIGRHSQATSVSITAQIKDATLILCVEDDGVGLRDQAHEHFGIRNAIRASAIALGGDASIANRAVGGAVVRISLPVAPPAELQVPAQPVFDVLTESTNGRVMLLAPALAGLFMLPWLTIGLSNGWVLLASAYACFFLANFLLASSWKSPSLPWHAGFAMVAGVCVYLAAQREASGCLSAPAIQWIINTVGGGFALLVFASFGQWWHKSVVPLVTAAGLWLALSLPAECRAATLVSVGATSVYLITAMWMLAVLWQVADRQRQSATEMWIKSTAERVEIERQQAITDQWSRVSLSTRELLGGIAEGVIDVHDPQVTQRARAEESALRANLSTPEDEGSRIWTDLLAVVNRAAGLGISVDVECIEFPKQDAHLSHRLVRLIDRIVAGSPSRSVTLRLFVDRGVAELVCVCAQSILGPAWLEEVGGDEHPMPWTFHDDDGVVVSVDAMEGELAFMSVRQVLPSRPSRQAFDDA